MKRTIKDYVILSAKGIAMGAADVVPGVSGGTIAFISGIYEELLETISSVNFAALKQLKTGGIKGFWQHINGNFLAALFLGIAISIVSLAKLITFLLAEHGVLLWSFFFGLIIASIILVGKKIKQWNITKIIGLIVGAVTAYYITILPPMQNPDALWFVFISGAIAICAMILPGISGSFILLLLGSYSMILGAIKDLKIATISVFAIGCLTGLLSFSKLLNWLFKHYHDLTVAILTGFLVGSLNKIWPWKHIDKFRINSHKEWVRYLDSNVLPTKYDEPVLRSISENGIPSEYIITSPNITGAVVMVITGLILIIGLEKLANKN